MSHMKKKKVNQERQNKEITDPIQKIFKNMKN